MTKSDETQGTTALLDFLSVLKETLNAPWKVESL